MALFQRFVILACVALPLAKGGRPDTSSGSDLSTVAAAAAASTPDYVAQAQEPGIPDSISPGIQEFRPSPDGLTSTEAMPADTQPLPDIGNLPQGVTGAGNSFGQLLQEKKKPPANKVLVEVDGNGDTYELIEVPESQVEEYLAQEEAPDPAQQWGAPPPSAEEVAAAAVEEKELEEDSGIVQTKHDPALRQATPMLRGQSAGLSWATAMVEAEKAQNTPGADAVAVQRGSSCNWVLAAIAVAMLVSFTGVALRGARDAAAASRMGAMDPFAKEKV